MQTSQQRDTGLWRTFITVMAVLAVVLAGVALGVKSTTTKETTVAAGGGTGQAAPATEAAHKVTIKEISRHPTDMPHSANFTRYEGGKALDPVTRSGPITIKAHFQLKEGTAEVLPGTTMDYWTFDGTVPGPMIRGRVGDTVDFSLTNPKDSTMPHNVDFHAVTGPGGGSVMLDTAPGATSELKVKLLNPGIYVYHCAFPDIPTHIAHGMYGVIVVEPEAGLPAVDHEFYVMQSEFYTVQGGTKSTTQLEKTGHLAFSDQYANAEQPTFVTFNGRPGALTGDRALGVFGGETVTPGQSVRIFVGNIGPNLLSSFHVIGEIFDTVYVEGSFDLVNHNVQTTLVPAGGAAGVEFRLQTSGDYVLVDHAIFRVHKGALGVLTVKGAENTDVYQPVKHSEGLRGASSTGGH